MKNFLLNNLRLVVMVICFFVKSVFEATMTQVTAIRDDIKEIRSDIKSILKEKR